MPSRDVLNGLARRLFGEPKGHSSPDLERLVDLLGIPARTLLVFCGPKRPPYTYRTLRRAKRDGSMRRIDAPSAQLKAFQHVLLRNYLDLLPVHHAAMGFRRRFSVADNARYHLGQAVVATADIRDFFDYTSAQRVRDFFVAEGWDALSASVLTGLCTLRGSLPQGAPTSPVLSNLVNVALDEALAVLARRSGARYTRYGDDLTLSWRSERGVPKGMQRDVQRRLLDFGYSLNKAKGWRVWQVRRGEEPIVTGVRLGRDGRLHPLPDVEAAMRRLSRHAADEHAWAQLQGYRGFVEMLSTPGTKQRK